MLYPNNETHPRQERSTLDVCTEYLKRHAIAYSITADGRRVCVEFKDTTIDFWHEGNFWMNRKTAKRGIGIESLAKQVLGNAFID